MLLYYNKFIYFNLYYYFTFFALPILFIFFKISKSMLVQIKSVVVKTTLKMNKCFIKNMYKFPK